MDTQLVKGFKKVCPYCNKEFISLHEKEIQANYKMHIQYCKVKIAKEKQSKEGVKK